MAEISGHHSLAAAIPFCDLLIFRFYAFHGGNPNNSGFTVLQAWLKHMLPLHMLSVKDLFLQEDIFFLISVGILSGLVNLGITA